jgi:CDP-diacylglycerol--serine O-phosphatidyltransferase
MARMAGKGKARLDRTAAKMKDDFPLRRYIPSALTILGMCSGATAIRLALTGNFKAAVIAIMFAAVCDLLDGRVARLFGVSSEFGAQLDSLSDLVSFGIAPSVLIYEWTLYQDHNAGWAIVLAFCACSAIRLARFNVESADANADAAPKPYFTGVPTPAAACLIMLPMLLGFQFKDQFLSDPLTSAVLVAVIAALMVSKVPTLSLKNVRVKPQFKWLVVAGGVALAGSAIFFPWSTLTGSLVIYLITIPFVAALFSKRRMARRAARLD